MTIIVSAGGSALLFLIGAVWQVATGRVKAQEAAMQALDRDFRQFQLLVTRDYAPNNAIQRLEERLLQEFRAIEVTQQRIFDELKGKADKS